MSDVTTELAMEVSDKAMEIARLKAENDRLREERDMYRDFSCNVGRYVGLRQGEYWERTENSNYYCGGCGWKVTDHDSYCPECGGALHEYALGMGTCKLTRASWDDGTCTWGCICSACDAHLEHETGIGYNYCPVCGRRIEQ